ncbi:hypothetical protein CF326_g6719 [Tilletia indica]|nr:hypothetical protein CF326_g6719 [Tilletia indica]
MTKKLRSITKKPTSTRFADAFTIMGYAYALDSSRGQQASTSRSSRRSIIQIFETFYHAALERSCELVKEFGTHETYQGSPASKDD